MNLWHAFILGIIEGITEFLPISSTGHLILAGELSDLPQTEFLKSFNIIIQVGAIFAVVLLYWRSLFVNFEIIKRIVVAFIPTAVMGLVFYKFIKSILLGSSTVVVWSLIIGGLLIIIFEKRYKEAESAVDDIAQLSFKKAMFIGIFQSIAMIPGVSRSAATIMGGLLLGLKRKTIVEFSFLLAVPTMIAAAGFDLIKSASAFSMEQTYFLSVGFVTSFIVAVLAIKFLLYFIQAHNFISFGIYRILVGLLFLFLI